MKKTFLIFSLILTLMLGGCSSTDKYVATIQNTTMNGSSHTYEEVFNNFFANPTWEHFTSTDEQEVVEFTGKCIYDNQEVEATIQFVITNETDDYLEWEASYLSFNDVSQSLLMLGALFETAIQEYPVKDEGKQNDTIIYEEKSTATNGLSESQLIKIDKGEVIGSG